MSGCHRRLSRSSLDSSSRRNTGGRWVVVAGAKYSKEQKERFFDLLDHGGTVRAAAAAVGVAPARRMAGCVDLGWR
jgi:hypothetical protein